MKNKRSEETRSCWQVTAAIAVLHVFAVLANPSVLKRFIFPLLFCKQSTDTSQSQSIASTRGNSIGYTVTKQTGK